MRRNGLLKAACALALLGCPAATAENDGATPATGVSGITVTSPGQSTLSQPITLEIDKSTVVDLPRPVADVVITNAGIADAVVQTRQRLIFRGIAVGQTNAFLFDDNGEEIVNFEIAVENDLSGLDSLLNRYMPGVNIHAESVNGNVVLTGGVESAAEAERALELVGLFGAGAIVNHLDIAAADQVLLEVRIVELSRTYLKQLGIRTQGNTDFGDAETFQTSPTVREVVDENGVTQVVNGEEIVDADRLFNSTGDIAGLATDGGFSGTFGYQNFVGSFLQSQVSVDLDALERIGVARTLAEPNLTTISGEEANFLAGGEIPVPTPPNDQGISGIEYRPFGVTLGFTPVVLSEDRISLQIQTEVSEIAAQGAVSGVPSFTTRNVESTVELPSGQSMMLAGLIQSRSSQQLDQIPGIKNVPVLGALFQSRDFSNDETELVIMITPYLVNPARKDDLRTPADGFVNPSDRDAVLFGKINQVYGKGEGALNDENYQAPVGFIEE